MYSRKVKIGSQVMEMKITQIIRVMRGGAEQLHSLGLGLPKQFHGWKIPRNDWAVKCLSRLTVLRRLRIESQSMILSGEVPSKVLVN